MNACPRFIRMAKHPEMKFDQWLMYVKRYMTEGRRLDVKDMTVAEDFWKSGVTVEEMIKNLEDALIETNQNQISK